MDFKDYIKEIDRLYHVGNTTEHSFRGALASYLQDILKRFVVTNEPRRIDCGAPDYVITLKDVPVAFLEAKDIDDRDLDGRKEHKAQFSRYKESLDRIIFTDYLDFHMYLGGEFADSVRIAETKGDHIVGIPENESKFNEMILHLATEGRQRITSSATLAKQMAAKAHLLAEAVKLRLETDGEDGSGDIPAQLRAFRNVLIHDLKAEEFADIYAQTIAYGMFTARLNDNTPEDFSRQEAANLIPKSNPFLRRIFQSIAGYDLDEGIAWIVDDLAGMFEATDAERIMRNYGSNKRHSDPIVHFYEDFLAEYDPKLRKSRGVWYTPAPVVKFIVKSVDEILQNEFNLPMGIADDSMIQVDHAVEQSRDERTKDGKKHVLKSVHRVQILDPATGTGTFLAEVIQQIRDKFDGMEGMWPSYVETNLIPRIHGFEILMASYTIAHLKLSTTLKSSGYNNQSNQRLKVYLTNSLEEATPRADNLFANWLSDEADEASRIKTDTPVMICLGNPPYSISSQNNGRWINSLIECYKQHLNEKNIQPLSDDYVKFIRLGQHYVERNGDGILAYITNNSYLDGLVHREMRLSLLKTFDKIFILNLNGYSLSGEPSSNGAIDENVFDIMQGVAIGIFVKTGKKNKDELATVYYSNLQGSRESKYDYLSSHTVSTSWSVLDVAKPNYYFTPKDLSTGSEYLGFLSVKDLFVKYNNGIETGKDDFFLAFSKSELRERMNIAFQDKYKAIDSFGIEDSDNYRFKSRFLGSAFDESLIININYRPFDIRACYYDTTLQRRPASDLMRNMLSQNYGLIVPRQVQNEFHHCFVSNIPTGCNLTGTAKKFGSGPLFPMFIYDDSGVRQVNFREEFVNKCSEALGESIIPEELFDYVYAVLHSNAYCKRYYEFLKIDFPRVPFPSDPEVYHSLSRKGAEMKALHMFEKANAWPMVIKFPIQGNNNENPVENIRFNDGKVYINDTQYFGGVSELVWYFYIGGYQPAQKWLKDRKGQKLEFADVKHYNNIIYALEQTDRIMKEIDEIGVV